MDEGTNGKYYDYRVPVADHQPVESLTVCVRLISRDGEEYAQEGLEKEIAMMCDTYRDSIYMSRSINGNLILTFLGEEFDLKKLAKMVNEQMYKDRFIDNEMLKECHIEDEVCCELGVKERVGDDYICLLDYPKVYTKKEYPYEREMVCSISSEFHYHAISMLKKLQTEEEHMDYNIKDIASFVYSCDEKTSRIYLLSEDFENIDSLASAIRQNCNQITPALLRSFLRSSKVIKRAEEDNPPFDWAAGRPFPGDDAIPCDTDGTGKIWKAERPEPGKITVTY